MTALTVQRGLSQSEMVDTLQFIENKDDKFDFLDRLITRSVYADPSASLTYANVYDSLARMQSDSQYYAIAKIKLGMGHYAVEQYDKSIQHYIDALQMQRYLPSEKHLALLLNNLATTYQIRGDMDKSIEYYKQSYAIYEFERDSLWMANINSNLGLLLLNGKRLKEAEPRIRSALTYFKRVGNTMFEGFTRLNLGNLLSEKGAYKTSILEYFKAIELVPAAVNPLVIAAANSGIGVAYSRLKEYQRSQKYLRLGLGQAMSINHHEQTIVCHEELAKLYEEMGLEGQALHHYKSFYSLKDSIFTAEQDAKLVEVLTKYESEKKEKEIALLNSQQEISQARIEGTHRILWVFSVGLILLSGLVYWLFQLNKKIKKGAAEKDTLLREIHHRVKNNLQVISALLTLQSKYIKDEHAKEALKSGQDRVQSMALIHKDLYQHENLKGVNTKEYFEKLVESLLESYQVDDKLIEVQYDIQSLWLDVDTMIPMGLMINELVSNALKHGFKGQNHGKLLIALREVGKELRLSIADNGKAKIDFDKLRNGFGFSLINSFARKLGAEVNLNNEEGFSIEMAIKDYTIAA